MVSVHPPDAEQGDFAYSAGWRRSVSASQLEVSPRRLKAPLWDAAWHVMGNTLEIVHRNVFSSGRGMWGIKTENRHWGAQEWVRLTEASELQLNPSKRGKPEELSVFWSHDAFFINPLPCCVTKGFCIETLMGIKVALHFFFMLFAQWFGFETDSLFKIFSIEIQTFWRADWSEPYNHRPWRAESWDKPYISCCSNASSPAERCICYLPHLLTRSVGAGGGNRRGAGYASSLTATAGLS